MLIVSGKIAFWKEIIFYASLFRSYRLVHRVHGGKVDACAAIFNSLVTLFQGAPLSMYFWSPPITELGKYLLYVKASNILLSHKFRELFPFQTPFSVLSTIRKGHRTEPKDLLQQQD